MDTQLRRDVRWLKIYALCSTAAFAILALSAFQKPNAAKKTKFEEIDVERINVVEKDGKLRLVISNRDRSPGPIAYGKPFGYAGGSRPGMIFFNDEGSENGGLTFDGKRQPNGKYSSTVHMSFDQYNEDQVIVLQYRRSDPRGGEATGLDSKDARRSGEGGRHEALHGAAPGRAALRSARLRRPRSEQDGARVAVRQDGPSPAALIS